MVSFVNSKKYLFGLTALLLTAALISLLAPGLNPGIEFTGGTLLERKTAQNVTTDAVRTVLDQAVPAVDLSGAVVQLLDEPNEFMVRTKELANEDILSIDRALAAEFGDLAELRTEYVGPAVGRELVRNAILAVIISSVGILAYITFRFEHRFAAVAVAALLHDVLLVLGFFALAGREINSSFIAAVLTVIGYSINDTIVIFDRIRENLSLRRRESLAELVDTSMKQSLSRTLNTSITTFIVVLMLVIFGGTAIRDFALALLLGIVFGTYSSLFLAGPLWLTWAEFRK